MAGSAGIVDAASLQHLMQELFKLHPDKTQAGSANVRLHTWVVDAFSISPWRYDVHERKFVA